MSYAFRTAAGDLFAGSETGVLVAEDLETAQHVVIAVAESGVALQPVWYEPQEGVPYSLLKRPDAGSGAKE